MFERYTEKARRVVFFARYEASHFGSPYIETEHLLTGLVREDKALAHRFLPSYAAIESIRSQIKAHTPVREKTSTSVDLPLSNESKRVLGYAAEESARLEHKEIDTPHLLIGLLREQESFAAQLLRERGLTLDAVRERVGQWEPSSPKDKSAFWAGFNEWLAEREAHGSPWRVAPARVGDTRISFALYTRDPPKENDEQDMSPTGQLAQIRNRIDFILERMEHAIANHEFEKARFYSDEEHKERENMRGLCEQFNMEQPPPRVPLLRIEIVRDDSFSELRRRCEDYISEGVAEAWVLDPGLKRAYTVTKTEGLREFKGEVLRLAGPPLEMDLKRIFE